MQQAFTEDAQVIMDRFFQAQQALEELRAMIPAIADHQLAQAIHDRANWAYIMIETSVKRLAHLLEDIRSEAETATKQRLHWSPPGRHADRDAALCQTADDLRQANPAWSNRKIARELATTFPFQDGEKIGADRIRKIMAKKVGAPLSPPPP